MRSNSYVGRSTPILIGLTFILKFYTTSALPCDSTPCQNSGVCTDSGDTLSYTCACGSTAQGPTHVGLNCEIDITTTDCFTHPVSGLVTNPCHPGGTCVNNADWTAAVCTCAATHTGPTCNFLVTATACYSDPCENGGTCAISADALSYTCGCATNYVGTKCEHEIPCAVTDPCQNAGVCVLVGDPAVTPNSLSSTCTCDAAYSGDFCQSAVACDSTPCQNSGVCANDPASNFVPSNVVSTMEYDCTCDNAISEGTNCETFFPCGSTPCQNSGFCVESVARTTYQCICGSLYNGGNCETFIPCSSSPCQNAATCTDSGDLSSYTCTCASNYLGGATDLKCETEIYCDSAPCQNSGTCVNAGDYSSYSCTCPYGYTGLNCENMLPCISNPCKHGSICDHNPAVTEYSCSCVANWVGTDCDVFDDCDPNPCPVHSPTCAANVGETDYECTCAPGYAGADCSTFIACNSSPCGSRGLCTNSADQSTFVCACSNMYVGLTCETYIPCSSDPCENGATCSNAVDYSSYSCSCTEFYQGSECQDFKPCQSAPCQNNGQCSVQAYGAQADSIYQCACPTGYAGTDCEKPEPCQNNPCKGWPHHADSTKKFVGDQNNQDGFQGDAGFSVPRGTCTPAVGWAAMNVLDGSGVYNEARYTCNCITGFSGNSCETYDACAGNPCNVASSACVIVQPAALTQNLNHYLFNDADTYFASTWSDYTCECNSGFTGASCDTYSACMDRTHHVADGINNADACLNGGQCDPILPLPASGATYTCTCGNFFTGDKCQTFMPCSSSPCVNAGVCTNAADYSSYTCACGADYTGVHCETTKPCSSSPCLNSATCANNVAFSEYDCECPSTTGISNGASVTLYSYIGTVCETFVPCSSNPCLMGGTCANSVDNSQYTCSCLADVLGDPIWLGAECQTFKLCQPNPCNNNEACNPTFAADAYTCQCSLGFFGVDCDQFEACLSNPCTNGGFCSNVNAGADYQCTCLTGYTGATCELDIPCFSSPCISGTCAESADWLEFTCTCPADKTGVVCDQVYPCLSDPCTNFGQCADSADHTSFACSCPFGYRGETCSATYPCKSDPCAHGGVCEDSGDFSQYACQCQPNNGWTGTNCDQFFPCLTNSCQNGATCVQDGVSATDYLCECDTDYTGTMCETTKPCSSDPCQNNGACTNAVDFSGFVCACGVDYTGSVCEIRIPSVFPHIYDTVKNANVDYFSGSEAATDGYLDVKNAMHTKIVKTTTCLRSLSPAQTTECVTNGEALFDGLTENKPSPAFKYLYKTIFTESTTQRALSKMLFDMSFQYMETYGFHWSHASAIVKCAESFCASDKVAVEQELEEVLSIFRPQNKGGARSAGKHPDLDWSIMVMAYDGESDYYPQDGFNFWLLDGNTTNFNHVNAILPNVAKVAPLLSPKEQKSWFTAHKLALINDFHMWCLFGDSGVFSLTSELSESAQLAVINTGKYFGEETITSMEDFKTKLHTAGKQHITQTTWMDYLPKLILDYTIEDKKTPYYKIMEACSSSTLLTQLGYTVSESMQNRINETFKIVNVMRIFYATMEQLYIGAMWPIVIWTSIILIIVLTAITCCVCKACCCVFTNKRKSS